MMANSEAASLEATKRELEEYERSYADMFGEVPPLPKAKFEFATQVSPEALKIVEQMRTQAFYNDTFDMKTTQMMLFAMLLVEGSGAAKYHAIAAQRYGASWIELQTVVELATAVSALGPMNRGSALLNDLWQKDSKTD